MEVVMNKELFNAKVMSKSRNYFLDVKQSQRGDYYLIISESKKQEDAFVRQQIMVFNTQLTDFASAFAQCMQKLSELDSSVIWDPRMVGANMHSNNSIGDKSSNESEKPKRFKTLSDAEIVQEQILNVQNGKPKNAGLRWTDDDRAKVKQCFLNGDAVSSIAANLERSIPSINAELKKQGLIEVESLKVGARPF